MKYINTSPESTDPMQQALHSFYTREQRHQRRVSLAIGTMLLLIALSSLGALGYVIFK